MECVPEASADVVIWAWPATRVMQQKKAKPPSLKFTVPVGGPPSGELTVAVNVTDWPTVEGFALEDSATVVASPLASNAPMEGGFARITLSKSSPGRPAVNAPCPAAGDESRMRRL